jgi:hypothetical protein
MPGIVERRRLLPMGRYRSVIYRSQSPARSPPASNPSMNPEYQAPSHFNPFVVPAAHSDQASQNILTTTVKTSRHSGA